MVVIKRLLAVLVGISNPAIAQTPDLLLYTEVFPPYNYIENNKLVGINADIVHQLCLKAKLNCKFELLPWKRAMTATMSNKKAGLFTTSRSKARENQFSWVGPIVSGTPCFYKLKNRKDISFADYSTLKNYTVGVMRNDVYQNVLDDYGLKEGKHYLTFSKKYDEISAFKQGKLDLIISSSLALHYHLRNYDLSVSQIAPAAEIEDDTLAGNYLALNKNTDKSLINTLQDSLDELKKSEIIKTIVGNYVVSEKDYNNPENQGLTQCINGSAYF